MYKLHTHCRACGYAAPQLDVIKNTKNPEKLVEVFDLGLQPLANDFCRDGEERAGYAPLKVLLCPRCSLGQLSVVANPKIVYSKYAYVTSKSDMMKRHFEALWGEVASTYHPQSVLEIGSNDGEFLAYIRDHSAGLKITGVDPALNLVKEADKRGVETLPLPWDVDTAKTLLDSRGTYDCIIARHVFCHIDDWRGFIKACETVSNDNTVVIIEAPYAGDTLKNCEFDQCYHEHLSFLTYKAVDALLAQSQFKIVDIKRYEIHGGASAVFLQKRHAVKYEGYKKIRAMIDAENLDVNAWAEFACTAKDHINRLQSNVLSLRVRGFNVAGLGASAKSTVWVNACGFNRKHIAFIADNTPYKQLTTTPGSDIPIVDEGAILRELPNYVILFAWNFRDEVLEKFKRTRELGVKFIIPVPTIEVV